MSDVTLEKVDIVRERTGVTYSEAKEALESCGGNVVDALIYLEGEKGKTVGKEYTTKDELVGWIKELIKKGNVTRIKVKKSDKVIVDIPVTSGIAITGLAYFISPLLVGLSVVTAIVTKVTIEITKQDGSVEIVNKIIKGTVEDVKDKFSDLTVDAREKIGDISGEVKEKVNDIAYEVKEKLTNKNKNDNFDGNVYKYTVKFEEVNEENRKDGSDNDKF